MLPSISSEVRVIAENGDASNSMFLYLWRRGTIVAGLVSSASGFAEGGLRYLDASSRALGDLDQRALLALARHIDTRAAKS
jgi:hypothetical protein